MNTQSVSNEARRLPADTAASFTQPSGMRALRPRARLLRTLGSDLISSEKVALIELVKNAFDADASVVLIRFCDPLLEGEGSVDVWDDGHGMNAQTLQTSWLDIATDVKKKSRQSESGNRRVLGEKGIGRLAAARLGRELFLTTRRVDAEEVSLLIDWRDFDLEDAYLDEIEVAWDVHQPEVFAGGGDADLAFQNALVESWQRGRGTLLHVEGLSKAWAEADFLDLKTALARLVRPRPASANALAANEFKIVLELPDEFGSLSGEVGPSDELLSPHYHLTGKVDSLGVAQLRYTQLDPPLDEFLAVRSLWTDSARAPRCGPFELDIAIWDRDRDAIKKVSGELSLSGFRQLLDQVAGVSVYRDGFRVLPFGEAGDDWLGLDRRRIQNPTMKVSNNQVLGHVVIGADANSELRDQSNREGLLEGQAYDDLQRIIQEALVLIEGKRYLTRREQKTPTSGRTGLFARFELKEIRSALAASYPNDSRILGLLDAKNTEIQDGVGEIQRVLSQYSRLATLGSLVDRVIHDGRTAVSGLKNTVRFGERDLAKKTTTEEVKLGLMAVALQRVHTQTGALATLFNQIEPFSGRKRGKPKIVSLRKIVEDAVAVFDAEAQEIGASVRVTGDGVDVSVDPAEILIVVVNLVQNALYWLSTTGDGGERSVRVDLRRNEDESVAITVSDSGPGVPVEFRDVLFDPYFSGRPDGIGLGLSIAGNMVQDFYDGELKLLTDGPLSGATFEATLRRRV